MQTLPKISANSACSTCCKNCIEAISFWLFGWSCDQVPTIGKVDVAQINPFSSHFGFALRCCIWFFGHRRLRVRRFRFLRGRNLRIAWKRFECFRVANFVDMKAVEDESLRQQLFPRSDEGSLAYAGPLENIFGIDFELAAAALIAHLDEVLVKC